jgi:hypothetical protein
LTAKETITYHREFLRLKGYYKLYQIYPEIEQSLPSFLKLFKGLKKHGLNPQNVEWYVDTMNIGMKLEGLEPDYENVQSKNQSLRSENQDIVNGIQYNRRIFENQSRAMQEHITGLFKVAEQQQQNVDTLSERIAILYIKEQEQERIVSRFKDTNKTYRKVKSIAEEQVNKFWSQALKEPDKKGLFSIVLSSMAEALRQNPQRYDIIFNNDNNNDNSNNNAQKQDAVLEVSNRVSNALIEKLVNDTMATLESQTESEDTELHAAEETESKDKEVAAAEDETKPEE